MKKYWTETEEKYLSENYKSKSNNVVGMKLNRSRSSVKGKLERMGLCRTNEDISNIISNGMRVFFKTTGKTWNRMKQQNILYDKEKDENHYWMILVGYVFFVKLMIKMYYNLII